MIRDRNIEWARQRMYIPAWSFQGYIEAAGVLGGGVGDPIFDAMIANEFTGMEIAADSDAVSHIMEFPSFWDITKPIGVRIRWGVVGTVATDDAILWTFLYDAWAQGTVVAAPATALDTAILIQSPSATTTLRHYVTSRGIINANKFTEAKMDGLFGFNIAADITQFSANEVHLLGVSFDYIPLLTVGGPNTSMNDRTDYAAS